MAFFDEKEISLWYNEDGSFNYENIRKCQGPVVDEESCEKAVNFQPRSTDIIIATPPKCGTTWLQQICHQLRTGGDMEFPNVIAVVPWLEGAGKHGSHDISASQRAEPRCFKTHFPQDACPKGGKYIAVFRNPCAAAYSYYKFMRGKSFPEELPLDSVISEMWIKFGEPPDPKLPWKVSYFDHLLSWLKHKDDPNVLILFFEEMKEDLEKVIRSIALFMGIKDENKIRNACQMSTFDFMKANEDKFNGVLSQTLSGVQLQEPVNIVLIRKGSSVEGIEALSNEAKLLIENSWKNEITSITGYETYDELRHGIREQYPLKL